MSGQSYDAWWTAYPSTHVDSGRSVEVVTRGAFDALRSERDRLWQALADVAGLENSQGLTAREIASKALES